ncbi:MAG: LacI family DNA-binding transcriptional regulator, partial [Phycisphaerales bacterium]|nr:LacI family DNA-binding transcriptional regulator [Phycisphaerales bacterium]
MKDIAAAANVSVATVSRALQNHPAIPLKTRQRIQSAARRLGYRPNPLLGVLMTQIRSRSPSATANVACLHGEPPKSDVLQAQNEFLEGVRAAAQRFGYDIDFFDFAGSDLTPDDLGRIWKARSVRGVILSQVRASPLRRFPWDDYAWVVNGSITGVPDFHRVGNAIYEIVKRALFEALRHGYRRPGLAVRLQGETRVGFRWPAAFIGNLLRYGLEPSMDRIFQGEWTLTAFRGWY